MLTNSPVSKLLDITKHEIKMAEEYQNKGKCYSEYFKTSLANAKSLVSAFENPRKGSNPHSLYTMKEMEKINWQLSDSMKNH